MKLRFYQWIFAVLLLLSVSLLNLSFAAGFEYTVESGWGDYLVVGKTQYFEYTSSNNGVSWEIYFDHGRSRVERWENGKLNFLFDER